MDQTTPQTNTDCESCGTGMCGKCMKGGFPMPKSLLSFFLLLALTGLCVLFLLFVQAKREVRENLGKIAPENKTAQESPAAYPTTMPHTYTSTIKLPAPKTSGVMALEKAIQMRRSRRTFLETKVSLAVIGQMLWSGQGITDPLTGKRAAPSARESYSMTLYVYMKNVVDVEPGLYEYLPKEHALGKLDTVFSEDLMKQAGAQEGAQKAPVVFLIASSFGNYQAKTKSTNLSAVYMEAGHISQNMYLQTESLKMGTVTMAGFDSAKMVKTLQIDPTQTIVYLMPFGFAGPEVTIQ